MFLTERKMPIELLHYKALEKRFNLRREDKIKLKILERGYAGECLYDEIFEQVGHHRVYIFRDLYLQIENSTVQYDSIVVSDSGAVVNEIKNYSGDYRYEKGQWFNGSRQLSDDGITQVARAVNKLVQLGKNKGNPFEVTGKVIFPNDDFRLASDDDKVWEKIVMRSDLKRYFKQFKYEGLSDSAVRTVNVIKSAISENTYFTSHVDIIQLKKGLYCGQCGAFNLIKHRYHGECEICGTKESNEIHALRVLSDYKYLFYRRPMTRNALLELVGNKFHKQLLYRMLLKYCDSEKNGNKTIYTFQYYDYADALEKLNTSNKYTRYMRNTMK